MPDMSEAIDRVMAGPERRSIVMSEREKRVTAYHEAGHALVGHAAARRRPGPQGVDRGPGPGARVDACPARPRTATPSPAPSSATGWPCCMGGLSAEELVFDERTTGAADDIDRATKLARAMVTEFGMSDALGPQRFATCRRRAVPRPRDGPRGRLLRARSPPPSTPRSPRFLDDAHRARPRPADRHRRARSTRWRHGSIERETLDEDELVAVLGAGTTEGAA